MEGSQEGEAGTHRQPTGPIGDRVPGTVYLVGAGPGDPGLLTVRGRELLESADAIVFDALVGARLIEELPLRAELYDAGRRKGEIRILQPHLNDLLLELAHLHRRVVRLKGGDPFVFGRGGEEALALRAGGIPFEIVPGVTSGIAALAYAGIPLTHRGLAASATFVTGHQVADGGLAGDEAGAPLLVPEEGTLVVFMGVTRLARIAEELLSRGRSPETPAAVIQSGTFPHQRTLTGTLATIAALSDQAGITGPALAVFGEVVRLREEIGWFPEGEEAPPLVPEVHPPSAPWEIVLGPEGAAHQGREAPDATLRILAAGPGTTRALEARGLPPSLSILGSSPVAVATALRAQGGLEGGKFRVRAGPGDPRAHGLETLLAALGGFIR